jgi:soluble lytic murein transglycosylase-like protein
MRAESGGNPRAISAAGAMGLMQLMPATWRSLTARYGLAADPFDVHANILAGAAYLREMLDRYGDLPTALADYNA